jgi:predicted amidohydrolase
MVPPAESTVFRPGDRNPLVPLGDGTAAVAVCADVNRSSHAGDAAKRGARTYLASMFVIPADIEKDVATLTSYAARHHMVVALANYGGPSGGLPSAGNSAIWSETGELLVQLPEAGEGVAVAIESVGGWRGETVALDVG